MKNKLNCYNKSHINNQINYRPLSKISAVKNVESNSYSNSPHNSRSPNSKISGHKINQNNKNKINRSPSLEQLCKPPDNNLSFFKIIL